MLSDINNTFRWIIAFWFYNSTFVVLNDASAVFCDVNNTLGEFLFGFIITLLLCWMASLLCSVTPSDVSST